MTQLEPYDQFDDIRPLIHRVAYPPTKKETHREGGIKVHTKRKGPLTPKLKKGLEAQAKIARARGNELRAFRMDRKIGIQELAAQLGCAGKTIIKAETTTGPLTHKQVYKLRPFYGGLVDGFLNAGGDSDD